MHWRNRTQASWTVPAGPCEGWVLVQPEGLASDAVLYRWVAQGAEFAATFPAK